MAKVLVKNKITGGRKAYTKVPDMIICKDDGNTAVFVGERKTPWKHNIGVTACALAAAHGRCKRLE